MKIFQCTAFVIFCVILILSCAPESEPGSEVHIRGVTGAIDEDRIIQVDADPGNCLSYGRNYAEDRYGMLDQITNENVDQLAWPGATTLVCGAR